MTAVSYEIPHPDGYTFNDWAARVSEAFAQFGMASPPQESQWKDWVCSMFYDSTLTAMNIPSPEGFPTWQAWAARFVDSVR